MAITLNTIKQAFALGKNAAAVNAVSANASGGEILREDPGTGVSIALDYLEINCAADDTVTIREDTTDIIGPITFKAAAPVPYILDVRDKPLIITANKELQVITGGANAVQVYFESHLIS